MITTPSLTQAHTQQDWRLSPANQREGTLAGAPSQGEKAEAEREQLVRQVWQPWGGTANSPFLPFPHTIFGGT